ncbi:MAG: hypothetical protein ACD_84C00001G0008 [uncultured bacterium]|nr:MAG: hypothetical protein ACD_84C00001G0008 [uncultured bacterium]
MSTPEKKPVIKQHILDLSAEIAKGLKIDPKSDVVTVEEGLYVKLLPENLTKEQVIAVQEYNTRIAAAALHAVGTMAIPVMKKNADMKNISMSMPTVLKDSISVRIDRSRQVPDRDENNQVVGTKEKFGSSFVEYCMYGVGSRGQIKAVKTLLSEQAMAAFGTK